MGRSGRGGGGGERSTEQEGKGTFRWCLLLLPLSPSVVTTPLRNNGGLIMSFGGELGGAGDAKKRKLCGENVVLAFFLFYFSFHLRYNRCRQRTASFLWIEKKFGEGTFVIKLDVECWSSSSGAQGFLLLFTWTACT